MVLMKLIVYSLYFGGGCGSLEGLIFNSFNLREGEVVLKELIFNSFNFGECEVVLKELIF